MTLMQRQVIFMIGLVALMVLNAAYAVDFLGPFVGAVFCIVSGGIYGWVVGRWVITGGISK